MKLIFEFAPVEFKHFQCFQVRFFVKMPFLTNMGDNINFFKQNSYFLTHKSKGGP